VYLRSNDPKDKKGGSQWWFLDKRTRSIRAADDKKKALSNLEGKGFNYAGTMVARPWKTQENQQIDFYPGRRKQLKMGSRCIDVYGNRDRDGSRIILWRCHNGANQQWVVSGHRDYETAEKN